MTLYVTIERVVVVVVIHTVKMYFCMEHGKYEIPNLCFWHMIVVPLYKL